MPPIPEPRNPGRDADPICFFRCSLLHFSRVSAGLAQLRCNVGQGVDDCAELNGASRICWSPWL